VVAPDFAETRKAIRNAVRGVVARNLCSRHVLGSGGRALR
jgi:hypothetical protein